MRHQFGQDLAPDARSSLALQTLAQLPRRTPATLGWLLLLGAGTAVVKGMLAEETSQRVLEAISTNPDNLARHPLRCLATSPFVEADGTWLDHLLVVGLGLAICLGLLEWRIGTLRALAAAVSGHLGATLLTAVVVAAAVDAGTYPAEVRHALDYGVSYASISAIAAVTPLLPLRLRPWWVAAAVLYPLTLAHWYGLLPDFTTVGHILSAAIGLAAGTAAVTLRRRGR
ncbi:rhomboid-like protein [Kitasatospora sp. NPDC050543]|uniref:rhomboid-like protein n=1 Tax=Kitasatospora sp. NPDC050543 TaxID=3364054 RepID=UPI003789D91D